MLDTLIELADCDALIFRLWKRRAKLIDSLRGVQPMATVVDREGRLLSPCRLDRAQRLVRTGKAVLLSKEPFTIRLLKLPSEGAHHGSGFGR
jgi:hypothetical protein